MFFTFLVAASCGYKQKEYKVVNDKMDNQQYDREELHSQEDLERINTFKTILTKEGYFDEATLKKLKEHKVTMHKRFGDILCAPENVLEYYTNYTEFLPHFKNSLDIDLAKVLDDSPEIQLKNIYSSIFDYFDIKNKVTSLSVVKENKEILVNNQKRNEPIYYVRFESNGLKYEDSYPYFEEEVLNLRKKFSKDLLKDKYLLYSVIRPYKISNRSINFLLIDSNSPRRFISSSLGMTVKVFSMNLDAAKYFECGPCYAGSNDRIGEMLDDFSKAKLIQPYNKKEKIVFTEKYRQEVASSGNIFVESLLVLANCPNIKTIHEKSRFGGLDLKKDWHKLIKEVSRGEVKLEKFSDNIQEYERYLDDHRNEKFSYIFQYEVDGKLFKKQLRTSFGDVFFSKAVFEAVVLDLNNDSSRERDFFVDYSYIKYLNKEEQEVFKKYDLL